MLSEMITLEPDQFPQGLREIPQPPKVVYVEGTLPDPTEQIYLTVVGSRNYTRYGKEACETLIAGLAGYPFVIVSGLALGIDAIAHRAALNANLPTVAVPGSGLDRSVLYPSANRELANEILNRGGALLSEFEPTFRATIYSFPQRNRIMAGLSRGVLIVEARERSGTLITARLALDYNRDLFVVPSSIFAQGVAGSQWLMKQGATPVTSAHDLLDAYGLALTPAPKASLENLSPYEQRILDLLSEPLPRDYIIVELGLPTHEATVLLATLEIKGIIKEMGGEIHRV